MDPPDTKRLGLETSSFIATRIIPSSKLPSCIPIADIFGYNPIPAILLRASLATYNPPCHGRVSSKGTKQTHEINDVCRNPINYSALIQCIFCLFFLFFSRHGGAPKLPISHPDSHPTFPQSGPQEGVSSGTDSIQRHHLVWSYAPCAEPRTKPKLDDVSTAFSPQVSRQPCLIPPAYTLLQSRVS